VDCRIIVDTREQRGYQFKADTVNKALKAGDYSLEGFEERVSVERKSLPDLVRTIVHDKGRFHRELCKLALYDAACIVVEADLDALLGGRERWQLRLVSPHALMTRTIEITQKYRVPVLWCGSREAARVFTEHYLKTFFKLHSKEARP
jgi:ERCC4-type nuclease